MMLGLPVAARRRRRTYVAPSGGGSGELATLAASMSAGTWAELTVSNQNSVLGDVAAGGEGSDLGYMNAACYIPQSDRIQIVGADHGGYLSMHVIEYDIATNSFIERALGTYNAGDTQTGTGPGHGFDHAAVNPYTGDAYQSVYGTGSFGAPSSFKFAVRKRVYGDDRFTVTLPFTMIDQSINITFGTCWWSGSFAAGGGAGAQGCLMVFNQGNAINGGSANDCVINAFDPLTSSWFYAKIGAAPFYGSGGGATYHALAEYSPGKNVMVYGGGNAASNRLWKMTSDGTVTELTNVPSGKGVGIQQGLLINEPMTGNFLLLSAGELWELNPDGSGTWTQQTGSRVPPAGVGLPSAPDAMCCVDLPEHGVVAYITQPTNTGGTFYLYKHA